jgi:glucokinase
MQQSKAPTVLTLDAGGTNFVFSAVRDYKEVIKPITLPAYADDLEKCLLSILDGFRQVSRQVGSYDAISFAFPGPADYELGIIGDLPNFKAFNGDVPLGPLLEVEFSVPVFINNDGDLFAIGAAQSYLPQLNQRLRDAGSKKQFQNLIGLTLGTGFGSGIVIGGKLLTGDNSCSAEVHNTLNPFHRNWNAEESVSTRAIQRVYAEKSGLPFNANLMPGDIYKIAKGTREGNTEAARISFGEYGAALGASIANLLTLIDGIVVLGGGVSAGWDLFSPHMFNELNRRLENFRGELSDRLSIKVFNLEDPSMFDEFARGLPRKLAIPGSSKTIEYDSLPRTGIALSHLNASLVISLGAYSFALEKLSVSK